MVGHAHAIPLELVASMLEMADLAWSAVEHRRERKAEAAEATADEEISMLRSENARLISVLADNLTVLRNVYKSSAMSPDCPPDLHAKLVAVVENSSFLENHELHNLDSKDHHGFSEVLIHVDDGEPSLWVFVPHDFFPDCYEEVSAIDNENYIVITEENVVDGISNFIARSILESPKSKNLTPEELQKAMKTALGGIKDRKKWKNIWEVGKVVYTLSTWGIALAGLYRHRGILKAAAKGVGTSANLVLKVL